MLRIGSRSKRLAVLLAAVAGSFAGAPSAAAQALATNLIYTSVQPCRVFDTRFATNGTNGRLVHGVTQTFNVVGNNGGDYFMGQGGQAGGCALPGYAGSASQVQAVVLNFVAVGSAGAGDLIAWPSDQAPPQASIINYANSANLGFLNIANGIVLPVRQDVQGGDLSIRAQVSDTDVLADVVGYFSTLPGPLTLPAGCNSGQVPAWNGSNGWSCTSTGGGAAGGDLSGNYPNPQVASVGGQTASNVGFATTQVLAATASDTAGKLVTRDGTGDFQARTVTLNGYLLMPATNTAGTAGVITFGSFRSIFFPNVTNEFIGQNAGNFTLTGGNNFGGGAFALNSLTSGNANIGIGDSALGHATSSFANIAIGSSALAANQTGTNNIAVGVNALQSATGVANIGIGASAGSQITTGAHNIDIDNLGVTGDTSTIRIGTTQSATFVAGIENAIVSGGNAVVVSSSGQLGVASSSARYKEDVEDMGAASDGLLRLRPVTFHYKPQYDDGSRLLQYGLIAEEVAAVYPDLVSYDDDHLPQGVRYHLLSSMLLNEMQKLYHSLAAQQARIEQLERELRQVSSSAATTAKRRGER
jgi:hypothetical protein